MTSPAGPSPAEQWVAAAKRAAATDLISRIRESGISDSIYLLAGEPADQPHFQELGCHLLPSPEGDFHFGTYISKFASDLESGPFAYFGGASAPLLTAERLQGHFQEFMAMGHHAALVNNQYSSDWAFISDAADIPPLAERLPTDNSLGWVLQTEADYEVRGLDAAAATRADIDTPSDIFMILNHPDVGPVLAAKFADLPERMLNRREKIVEVLQTPASHLTLIGRASAASWGELERRTQIWVRLVVEERGMVASGRLARGEVKSMIGDLIRATGVREFINRLVEMSDGVLWDNRVWMASQGVWPSASERFAADLGWIDQLPAGEIREMVEAIEEAPIPIIAGGYGVVAGGLYALLESSIAL